MALIYVILSLLFERYLGSLREFRNYHWFDTFTNRVRELIPELAKRPLLGVILLLLLPAFGVELAYGMLEGIWWPLGVGFAFAMLLYGYGCQDLSPQIEAFIDARLRGDDEAARWHLSAMLSGDIPDDPQQLTRVLIETVLVELNDRLFAVIFWFGLLGPAGAVVFRFASLLKTRFQTDDDFADVAHQVYYVLAWVPARITAFSYALAGSFVESVQYRREEAHKWRDGNQGILVAGGLGALQYDDELPYSREQEIADLRAALALARRTVMIWLGLLAILTLLGLAAEPLG